MKTKIFIFFFTLIAGTGTIFASTKIGNLYYNLNGTSHTAEVTSQNSRSPYWSTTITAAIIPASVTYNSVTYSVTSIGDYAFDWCSGLTSVTIPNSVTSIGDYAFADCSGLTSVTIPNSVTSIGNYAFEYCTGLTSVTIPNSVTSIGDGAFSVCEGLTSIVVENGNSVYDSRNNCNAIIETATNTLIAGCQNTTIPNSVTSIGSSAFYGCTGLTSITIPDSVTSIGVRAFWYCTGLTSVTIPNSVTSIGKDTFGRCTGLTSVTIPNSVTSIGNSAFYWCSSLTSITIPNSVTSIGSSAFEDCTGLTSVTIGNSVTSVGDSAFYLCSSLTSVEIPNSVTDIGNYAFYKCTGLTSVTIDNSVTSIGNFAFAGCSGLTSVTIGNSVTSIEEGAFSGCSGLTSVTIPNSVTSIGSSAFSGCRGLTSVTIPNSVTSIGVGAFYNCTGLTSVTIGNSVTSIGDYAFKGCSNFKNIVWNAINCNDFTSTSTPFYYHNGTSVQYDLRSQITSFTFGEKVAHIPACLCYGMRSLVAVTIPNSVTSIGRSAFKDCSGLEKVSITDIAMWCNIAFRNDWFANPLSYAQNLYLNGELVTDLVIPNSVTSIGDYAFFKCTGLTSVEIPNSVTSIGEEAFEYCSSLSSVTIPNSVTSIEWGAFYSCTGLTSVTIEAETPPTLGTNAFKNTNNCPIYVPCGTLDAYKTAWSNYTSQIQYMPLEYHITGNVNIEGSGSVQLPQNKCEDIITASPNYGYHFIQWSDGNTENPRTVILTQDTTFTAIFAIDKSGTCGENNVLKWEYEDQSKTLTISANGALTENYTFGIEAPTQMRNLIIGNEVTSIGDSAFYGMNSVNHLTIGSNVSSIGDYAFAECKNFDDITCYASDVPTINATTFANIGNKQYIYLYVPEGRQRAYQRDTYWGEFDVQVKEAEAITQPVTEVSITPADNTATITWPTSEDANTYTLEISKDGVVFCTLIFNANGQLTGIAFAAPGKSGNRHAPAAVKTSNGGLRFTVTGLESGTNYHLTLLAKDSGNQEIASYAADFTTTGIATGIDNTPFPSGEGWGEASKLLRDGQIFILRGEKVYTLTGAEVK